MSDVKIEVGSLMIGNWIMIEGRPLQVLKIDSLNEHFGKKGTITVKQYVGDAHVSDCSKWVEDARPIPLDPTILEKCGFVKDTPSDPYCYVLSGQHVDIVLFSTNNPSAKSSGVRPDAWYLNYNKSTIVIQYLHQLQNLYFALTGSPLKVQL